VRPSRRSNPPSERSFSMANLTMILCEVQRTSMSGMHRAPPGEVPDYVGGAPAGLDERGVRTWGDDRSSAQAMRVQLLRVRVLRISSSIPVHRSIGQRGLSARGRHNGTPSTRHRPDVHLNRDGSSRVRREEKRTLRLPFPHGIPHHRTTGMRRRRAPGEATLQDGGCILRRK